MGSRFGSDRTSTSQNLSSTLDALGNPIISTDVSFGASPLGEAARTQVALGVPNGTFNLLPNDPLLPIDSSNPLPYWDFEANGDLSATMDYTDATQTWSVILDPNSAGSGDYAILKTRIPIINDEGLDVRHFVSSSLIQEAKPASLTAWTLNLTAQYYDTTGAAIGTAYTIGTLTETSTSTNLSSYTNTSGPIDTTAAELEIAYTITRGATGLSEVVAILRSVLVATDYGSVGGGGGGSYIPLAVITAAGDLIKGAASGSATRIAQGSKDQVLTVLGTALGSVGWADIPADPSPQFYIEEFNASTTWTVPTGVLKLEALVILGSGGGGGGGASSLLTTSATRNGGGGGGGGGLWYKENVYLNGAGSVVVTIGAGGAGGAGGTSTKAAAGTAVVSTAGLIGSHGGDTSFGSFGSAQGGRRGSGGGTAAGGAGGASATASGNGYWSGDAFTTSSLYASQNSGGDGGAGGSAGVAAGVALGNSLSSTRSLSVPYMTGTAAGTGATGGSATITGGAGSAAPGAVGGRANYWAGGAGAGGVSSTVADTGGSATVGGGGGGGAGRLSVTVAGTYTVTGGNGGNGNGTTVAGGGGGGGGGAAVFIATAGAPYTNSVATTTGGSGGNGSNARIVIAYIVP